MTIYSEIHSKLPSEDLSKDLSKDTFHNLNSDIADLQDPGLGLQGSLWQRIEGLYIHFLSDVTPLACIYW